MKLKGGHLEIHGSVRVGNKCHISLYFIVYVYEILKSGNRTII